MWKPLKAGTFGVCSYFFAWTASLGRILTVENLQKRNMLIVDWCYMDKNSRESVEHCILHCKVARDIRSFVWTLFGVSRVMPRTVAQMSSSWRGTFQKHRNAKA